MQSQYRLHFFVLQQEEVAREVLELCDKVPASKLVRDGSKRDVLPVNESFASNVASLIRTKKTQSIIGHLQSRVAAVPPTSLCYPLQKAYTDQLEQLLYKDHMLNRKQLISC